MDELRILLRDAEDAQGRTLGAIADDPAQVSRLKDPVLLLLDVLSESEAVEARHETLQVLTRLFAVCSAHFHDVQAFQEAATAQGGETRDQHSARRGNAVLKALLASLNALSRRDPVDDEAVHTLVEMTRDLCLQSMNAADVVALFDFLRLGRPPARRLVLQMQKSLMEMDTLPRAIFTMRGPSAGLTVPADQPLFTKRGYSCSFGVCLDSKKTAMALFSFRGQNGQGVSAMLDGEMLVIKMSAAQGAIQQVEVPFAEHRARMEKEWVHLCIVHAKKMVFKDKLTVYVDGKAVFNGNMGYPDPVYMVGGQNSIGIEPLVEGLDGKLWSPTLFGVALSDAEVQKLHWLTHWKNDLNSVAAENAGLSDKSKLCFSFDARSCDLEKRICYDVSGNDCHGEFGPGTSAYVTHSFVHALDSVGGCACFLLLLLDQVPEMADFHPMHEFGMGEISDLLAFVGAGLQHSTMCRSHFARLQGVKVVEFILQAISPSYLSVHLLDGVVSILEAMTDFLDNDDDVVEYIYRLLFFNTSWFLSPFETQGKLLSEVLPKYLQLIQKAELRERNRSSDTVSHSTNIGKLMVPRALSLADFPQGLNAKDRVDVSFFCRLITQVYIFRADKDTFTADQMTDKQMGQLRELIIQKLVDLLLFPSTPDPVVDQWRQLVAYIIQQCETSIEYASGDDNGFVDVEDFLVYLTQNLASAESRRGASNAPSRQLQVTSNVCKLSKGTVRILWRPMLSTSANVRLAALQFFESYTSDKVLLHKSDMLMLHSAFQPHMLTANVADLLLSIIIGRKQPATGNPTPHASMRTGSFARMAFIPLVLLGLIHNADFDVQARMLADIKVQLTSPTMGDSVKEAIRSWPSWMGRLRSLSLAASVAAATNITTETVARERSSTELQTLNEACVQLSSDSTSISAKLKAIELITDARDMAGCDFALSLLENSDQTEDVSSAIIAMVISQFPQRCCKLVRKLANQMIIDIVVYCVLFVRNGWMHFLEFYFFHCRAPSDYCNLTASICEQILRRIEQKHPMPQIDIMWENLCQVAAVTSQSSLVATKMEEVLKIHDAVLSHVQWSIIVRKSFELWRIVLPHLNGIKWDDLTTHLVQHADYGQDVTSEEMALFSNLVALQPRASFLALQITLQYVTLIQANGVNDESVMQQFYDDLALLKLIVPLSSTAVCDSVSPALSGIMSPPLSGSVLPDMALSLPLTEMTESAKFLETVDELNPKPDREMIHLNTLDICFSLMKASLEGANIDTTRIIVKIMVALANTALHLRDSNAAPELTKTLQIISSTDLTFFNEPDQFQELYMLWQLYLENHQTCCDQGIFQGFVEQLNAGFLRRWMYVMENHTMEFNPYLIQQYASSQAELLGDELQRCEKLWEDITDENEAAKAHSIDAEMENESRLAELKHVTEKFASSVHKLLARSGEEYLTVFGDNRPIASAPGNYNQSVVGDGVIFKINFRENGFRMRLRLKRVREDYRIRNVSCDHPGSSLTDTEGGKNISRRFRGSVEGGLVDLENSWRSDTGSDYSDFLADAQMRAAIIRSLSTAGEYDNMYGAFSDEDDLDTEDAAFYDTREDKNASTDGQHSYETQGLPVIRDSGGPAQSDEELFPQQGISSTSNAKSAEKGTMTSSYSASPPTTSLVTSPPLNAYSLGASVLNAVGGVADYFQKSVKDAKDVVEFGVDTLYTTKETVSEEAQALMQEVSTYMENSHPPDSQDIPVDSITTGIPSLALTPSSLKMMESNLSSSRPSDEIIGEGTPELFPSSPSARNSESSHEGTVKRAPDPSRTKTNLQVNAQFVRHLHVVEGVLILSQSSLRFVAERVIDENEAVIVEKKSGVIVDERWRFLFKRRRWNIDDITNIYRRRYLLKPTALELFIRSTRKNYFFNLALEDVVMFHEALMAHRPLLLKRDPSVRRLRHPSSLFRNSTMSIRWVQHEISTFEYLMWLNTIAGRTYNDLTQYPVFPWIISDYESATLDLTRRGAYRDLSKPMGALEPSRLKFFIDRYHAFEDPDIPKFMYGTHYSNIGSVLYYLVRLEPFTSYALNIQGGKFDHADRLFQSVAETWHNCLTDYADLKELTPEWFYLPEFLMNCNKLDLGIRQNGTNVDDVILPPWATSPEDFVMKNLVALESEYVSANIHQWIDLVFGWKQRGSAAVEANNVFFYLTYEGMVDVDSITDPIVKSSMQSQIAHFGQTPTQVLRDPHPRRLPLSSTMLLGSSDSSVQSPLFPTLDANYTLLSVPHDAPIVMVNMVQGTSMLICMDNNGMLSSHRFGPKLLKSAYHYQSPFLSDVSASPTKSSGTSKTKGATSNVSSGSEQPSEFIELLDRKSRKILGNKRLLSNQQSVFNSIAILHGGMVLCTVGHHDFSARFHSTTDGTLLYRLLQHQSVVTCVNTSDLGTLLTLGCNDGTISVWKVATINSTLLDSLKIFRGSKASSKPVHANDYSADQVLLGHSGRINCVSASDELGVCISGSTSNECLVHDLEDGSILRSFNVPGSLEPGVISLAVSNVGHVVLQSVGTGIPKLYSYHLNGTLLAELSLGDHIMTSLNICARYSKVVVSNSERALVMTAHTLGDQRVLLEKDMHGEISAQGLAPDEMHVVFGVGTGKIICLPILTPTLQLHLTEM